jgi:uncharacterized protein YcbK (DUF882 family)
MRRLLLLGAILAFLGGAALAPAPARAKTSAAKSTKGKGKKCTGKKCKSRGRFSGFRPAASALRTTPLPRASGHVRIIVPATREEVDVNIYNADGSLNQESLAKLDHAFRCRVTGEERAIDPRLYEILSLMGDHWDKRVNVVSGFRFQRNEGSRHYHGSAMDITVDGVAYTEVYKFADSLDTGGMGIGKYPRSSFVHVDFRAPGETSYRWTDTSGPGVNSKHGGISRRFKRPNS